MNLREKRKNLKKRKKKRRRKEAGDEKDCRQGAVLVLRGLHPVPEPGQVLEVPDVLDPLFCLGIAAGGPDPEGDRAAAIRGLLFVPGETEMTGASAGTVLEAVELVRVEREQARREALARGQRLDLTAAEIDRHPDKNFLRTLKHTCRFLTIDGPNCVIGCLPYKTLFMVQDSKKLRPGVVGGVSGKYGLMSEVCGLDRAVPQRDKSEDIFPMKYDMVIIAPGAREVTVWNQLHG